MSPSWNRFFRDYQKDLKLWLFFLFVLTVSRIAFLGGLHQEIAPNTSFRDLWAILAMGFRFDVMVATYWILVPLSVSVWCANKNKESFADRLRTIWANVFLGVSILLSLVSVEYYREYHDVFNLMLFKAGDDDISAIWSTIYSGYHPFVYLTRAIALLTVGCFIRKRFFTGEFIPESVFCQFSQSMATPWKRRTVGALIGIATFVAMRGSLDYRPVQVKDAAITADRFLNKAALNPHLALLEATVLQRRVSGDGGFDVFLPDYDIVDAIQEAFPKVQSPTTIDQCLEREAAGPRTVPPRHIYLMQLESYDAWPLLDKYAGLGLMEQGRRLAKEGLHLQAFLPSGGGTIEAFSTLVTGMPFVSLQVRLEMAGRRILPTSLPDTMRRLGYRTRFFYSGYLSWQEVGDFALSQGFDEVYGAVHAAPDALRNEWGVADQYLFDLVSKTVTDDRPSFNFIMTTLYHPPYNFDLNALGVSVPEVPKDLEAEFEFNNSKTLNMFGHLRYADRSLGEFVDRQEKIPKSLFVITGDHWSRRFINSHPTLFESSAVPLILYGKEVLQDLKPPENAAGSHVDVATTLIEIAAPKGFKYWSMGHDLFNPKESSLGYTSECIVTRDFIMPLDQPDPEQIEAIPGRTLPETMPDLDAITHKVRLLQGITWKRIHRGADLPQDAKQVRSPQASSTR